MLLMEIKPETKVIFELDMNGQNFEFPSVVIGTEKNGILTEPIRVSGKILSFENSTVKVNLIMNRDGMPPIVWKGVGITVISTKGGSKYKLIAGGEGVQVNRRESFRLFIGMRGVVQIGANKKAIEIIVKDVSDTGFSFVSDEDYEDVQNKPVRLVFNDFNQSFSLIGLIVRKVVIDEKKIIYGCKLGSPNSRLTHYITEKQRQMLSMNKNNTAYKDKSRLEQALRETPKDVLVEEKKKTIRAGQEYNRDIDTVEKNERRDIFKYKTKGKRV